MGFQLRILGKDLVTFAVVDTKHEALRVGARPMELGARGAYQAAFVTGILPAALGANSEIFQWRWVNAGTIICLPRAIYVSAAVSTTAFAAGVPPTLEARIARAWAAQGTGGTGITWGANDGKKRTSHGNTQLGANDVRIATNLALGAGTKTLDGVPFGTVIGNTAVATATTQVFPPFTPLWVRQTTDSYPLHFLTQEGFVIRSVQIPPTGTWTAAVIIEWDEIDTALVTGWS